MQPISEPRTVTAPNAHGRDSTTTNRTYRVEESDIGIERQNYLGYKHRAYTLKRSDVGRVIVIYNDGTDWTMWTFND